MLGEVGLQLVPETFVIADFLALHADGDQAAEGLDFGEGVAQILDHRPVLGVEGPQAAVGGLQLLGAAVHQPLQGPIALPQEVDAQPMQGQQEARGQERVESQGPGPFPEWRLDAEGQFQRLGGAIQVVLGPDLQNVLAGRQAGQFTAAFGIPGARGGFRTHQLGAVTGVLRPMKTGEPEFEDFPLLLLAEGHARGERQRLPAAVEGQEVGRLQGANRHLRAGVQNHGAFGGPEPDPPQVVQERGGKPDPAQIRQAVAEGEPLGGNRRGNPVALLELEAEDPPRRRGVEPSGPVHLQTVEKQGGQRGQGFEFERHPLGIGFVHFPADQAAPAGARPQPLPAILGGGRQEGIDFQGGQPGVLHAPAAMAQAPHAAAPGGDPQVRAAVAVAGFRQSVNPVVGQPIPGGKDRPAALFPPGEPHFQAGPKDGPGFALGFQNPEGLGRGQAVPGTQQAPDAPLLAGQPAQGAGPHHRLALAGRDRQQGVHPGGREPGAGVLQPLGAVAVPAQQAVAGAEPEAGLPIGGHEFGEAIDLGAGQPVALIQQPPAAEADPAQPQAPGAHPEGGAPGGVGAKGIDAGPRHIPPRQVVAPGLAVEGGEAGVITGCPEQGGGVGPRGEGQGGGIQAGKTLGRPEGLPALVLPAHQAPAPGTGPDFRAPRPRLHLQQVVHLHRGLARAGSQGLPGSVPEDADAGVGGGPEFQGAILLADVAELPDPVIRQALGLAVGNPGPFAKAQDAGAGGGGPDFQPAAGVGKLHQVVDAIDREPLVLVPDRPDAVETPKQSRTFRAHPQGAVRAFQEGPHVHRGHARRQGQRFPFPAFQPEHAFLGGGPKAAQVIQEHLVDRGPGQHRVPGGEHGGPGR